jgi:2-iminobutanoate/2-iminopropanoate deaminase
MRAFVSLSSRCERSARRLAFDPPFIARLVRDIIRSSLDQSRQSSEKDVSLTIVHTDQAPAAIGPYSQGVVANGFLYTAGQIAIDPANGQIVAGDVRAQTERVMVNLAAVLGTVNASWKDVVKTTIFLQDMNDFSIVNDVYGRTMGDARPARSTVQVAGLPRGVAVEIEAVVAIPS